MHRGLTQCLPVALVTVLAGCGLGDVLSSDDTRSWVDLTPSTVVGVWQDGGGESIEFTDDGFFFSEQAAGSGRWEITKPPGHEDGKRASVALSFDVVAGQPAATGNSLLARRIDDRVQLADNKVAYYRCETGCPRLAPDRSALGTLTTARAEQIIGEWRDQNGALLALNADGSYSAEDLRFAYARSPKMLPPHVTLDAPLSSEGTWVLKPETTVVLTMSKVAGKPDFGHRPLLVYAKGEDLNLVTVSSNPDVIKQYIYRR
ncbi:MAG TPA: hypothetical protein VF062_02250 [Candidatus Limnocylindrales bacterium]